MICFQFLEGDNRLYLSRSGLYQNLVGEVEECDDGQKLEITDFTESSSKTRHMIEGTYYHKVTFFKDANTSFSAIQ